jgi:rhodanese-related sulfurtransferase
MPASGPRSCLVVAVVLLLCTACAGGPGSASSSEPWGEDAVEPAQLAKELASGDRPVVVCTAPPFLYRAGHIPGAVLQGPMTSPKVQEELAAWAHALPRSTNLVIYCGCCPMAQCPNVRPAYKVLKDLGFTRLRVLILPANFATDWAGRGHPVER